MVSSLFLVACYVTLLFLGINWAVGIISLPENSIISSIFGKNTKTAKKILEQLKQLIILYKQLQIQIISKEFIIVEYKFYTTVIQDVLKYSTEFGAPITSQLKSLRTRLIADWEFENKLSQHLLSTLAQMLAFSAITWGFGLFCQYLLGIWPQAHQLIVVGSLQMVGGLIFLGMYHKKKTKTFLPYEACYRSVTCALTLQQLGLPLHYIVEKCELASLPTTGHLGDIHRQLQELFEQCHHRGQSIKDFILELREELDFYLEEDFKKFLQFTTRIKFSVLALFYFPAYLIFILALFGNYLPS